MSIVVAALISGGVLLACVPACIVLLVIFHYVCLSLYTTYVGVVGVVAMPSSVHVNGGLSVQGDVGVPDVAVGVCTCDQLIIRDSLGWLRMGDVEILLASYETS